ncbi:cytochrome c oxidase assembly factor CtaG [Falsibacillus pallidus]|uniref:cytochrome c oxidase assembly factor CtaG n=1 Tax=Falsibacillus pallidus TaxID=493781 RepID=UPI003D955C22
MSLSIFGFRALWSPYLILSLLIILGLYFMLTVVYRKRFKNSEPLKKRQAIQFTGAIIILYVIKGSPIDLLGHILFSVHMIQMAVLYLILPPIMMTGIPNWIWQSFINLPIIRPIFHFFTKPLIALILFNGLFSFYHVPIIFDTVKMTESLHVTYTAVLFIYSVFMWWPLVNKLPDQYQLSGLKKMGYVFAGGILLTPACALIIFADTPLYQTYADASSWLQAMSLCVPTGTLSNLSLSGPQLFTDMPVVEDQQLGGVVMKIIQEIVYGILLGQIFFQWFKKEQKDSDRINEEALKAFQNSKIHEPRPIK